MKIVSIYKKWYASDLENCRPIELLAHVRKIIESALDSKFARSTSSTTRNFYSSMLRVLKRNLEDVYIYATRAQQRSRTWSEICARHSISSKTHQHYKRKTFTTTGSKHTTFSCSKLNHRKRWKMNFKSNNYTRSTTSISVEPNVVQYVLGHSLT